MYIYVYIYIHIYIYIAISISIYIPRSRASMCDVKSGVGVSPTASELGAEPLQPRFI